MKSLFIALASCAALSAASFAHAQDIPVLVEDAAQAGWAYGDNGNITTPQTVSEEMQCGAMWSRLDQAYKDGEFDADLVESMPEQIKPAAASAELNAWSERLQSEIDDPMATFRADAAANHRWNMMIGKAAAGDPQSMFVLGWNYRGCLISTAE